MNNRLKLIRKHFGINQKEMGDKIKLSQTHISSLENGAREITDRIISDICREFNVNEHWLRTGEGEMFVQKQTFSLDEKAKQHNLSQLETDIIKGYMELPLSTRKDLLELFGSVFKHHAATVEAAIDPIELELESYRKELEAEKKGATSFLSRKKDEIG